MEMSNGSTGQRSCTEKRDPSDTSTGRPDGPAGSTGSGRDGRGRFEAGDDRQRFLDLVHQRPAESTRGFGPCSEWRGRHTQDDAYPLFDLVGGTVRAHRYAWENQFELFEPELWVLDGPWAATTSGLLIPDGWTLDHLCHTFSVLCAGGPACPHTSCVCPRHLEPVTRAENLRRRHARDRALAEIRKASR